MAIDARRQQLSELLALKGHASLSQLVDDLGVSESTVRRDLTLLEEEGLVRRTHGGAFFIGERQSVIDYKARETTAVAQKQAIGRVTAELVEDNETILLNGGTTTYQVARNLANRPLQVVTNSLQIANYLTQEANIEVIFVGGNIYPKTGDALGPIAQETLKTLKVSKAILGTAGITKDAFYNANVMMMETDQQMIKSANQVIVVADASKFGNTALAIMSNWEEIDVVVSDRELSKEWQEVVGHNGAKLILAE
ncbi:MAG: DeoR/GlpR family DNA-binding transcription regulator [Planctomycetota bacterium]|jgi:DeoR/GlpR family transcriptional regulator of sugar metabolism